MQRRNFIKSACMSCLTIGIVGSVLESCGSILPIQTEIIGDEIIVPLALFENKKSNENTFKKYIIIQNNNLQFPICIYRNDANNFTALWMRCPHQGAELQVFGDVLQCPAHGSEFDKTGKVNSPPAIENLRTFPVKVELQQIKISLK